MRNKAKSKFMILMLVAAMFMSSFFANFSLSNAKADSSDITDVNGDKITVSDFGDDVVYQGVTNGSVRYKVELGGKVEFPTITVNGTKLTMNTDNYVVTDSNNKVLTTEIVTENVERPYFVATQRGGYYKMAIKDVTTDGKVVTVVNNIRIDVEAKDYSIVSPSNSEYVIPSQIPANWTATSGNKLKIAVPTVFEGKEEVTDLASAGYSLVVEIKKPDGSAQELTKAAAGTYYEYDIPATVGMYRIVYKLTSTSANAGNVTLYSRSTEFEVVKALDVKTIKIKGDANSSRPTTAEVGKEITLPSYTYYNDTNDKEIKAYTDIKITCHTADGPVDYSKYVKDFKFTPLHKGVYQVTYTAKIGLFTTSDYACEKKITTFALEDVDCTTEPEVRTSYGYEFYTEGPDKGLISRIYTSFDYLNVTGETDTVSDFKDVEYVRASESGLIEKVVYTVTTNGVKEATSVEYTDLLKDNVVFNNYSVQRYIDTIVDDALVDTLSVAELETHAVEGSSVRRISYPEPAGDVRRRRQCCRRSRRMLSGRCGTHPRTAQSRARHPLSYIRW